MTKEVISQAELKKAVHTAVTELLNVARLERGDLLVVGCSTSEIRGSKIGTDSAEEMGQTIVAALQEVLVPAGINLGVQCCEHLNRVIIIEKAVAKAHNWPIGNVVPQLHAGGATSMAAWATFKEPVAVEHVEAEAGLDIGDTFIGMHLKPVVVPVRLSIKSIGEAHLTAARIRPKYIGGPRAVYDDALM
ncbi:TIGR01440 family protein [uncultured Veillonella sp.]|uniref:TIGR01440 family protein n=1 Tax=uncultured Veillonella sp. TaxID=159268 RepID=UPI0025E511B6|nr:TIGR01440 family protein [uncultured Veillonella sp.]MDY3973095.1 TIGR01440 family protein [Veillonella caviae]